MYVVFLCSKISLFVSNLFAYQNNNNNNKLINSQESKHKSHLENATKMHQNVEALSSLHFNFYQELKALQTQEVSYLSIPIHIFSSFVIIFSFFFNPFYLSSLSPLSQEKNETQKEESEGGGGGKEGGEEKKEITLGGVVKEKLVGELSWYREYTQNFENYQQFTEEKAFKRFLEAEVSGKMERTWEKYRKKLFII